MTAADQSTTTDAAMAAEHAELVDFICTYRKATRIYLMGIEAGYAQGFAAADRTAETHAEHAARIFYAMEAEEAHRLAACRAATRSVGNRLFRAEYLAQQPGGTP